MLRLKMLIVFGLVSAIHCGSRAADCMGWYKHLCIAHEVCLLKESKPPIRNSNYNYTKIPKTSYVVASKKQFFQPKITWSDDGQIIEIRQGPYTYIAEFKNGQCQNNRGDSIVSTKEFNYNWQICESLLKKFRKGLPDIEKAKSDAEIENAYRRLLNLNKVSDPERKQILENLSKKLKKDGVEFEKTDQDLQEVIQKCKGQTELIELQSKADPRRYPPRIPPTFGTR